MTAAAREAIEFVLPVHNEALSIAVTLHEFHRAAIAAGLTITFRVSEDGSTDGTQEVLRRLESELPLVADCVAARRGYSQAVVDGLRAATAPIVGFIDSDGQCDPHDLPGMIEALVDHDVVFGFRSPRVDSWIRKVMSWAFGTVFQLMFHVPRRDPSCPYLLIRRELVAPVLGGNPGILPQGFWWEFSARVSAGGFRVAEVPVHHRPRAAGRTMVYRPSKVPGIALVHLVGLVSLRRDLARSRP